MEWLLDDPVVVPVHDALGTERVHCLPNTVLCQVPEADYPYPVCGPSQAQRPLTLGSFNNLPSLKSHMILL